MNCNKALKYISEYIDGELKDDKKIKLLNHLDECPLCSRELDEFKNIKNILTSSLNEKTDQYFNQKLLSKIECYIPNPGILKPVYVFAFITIIVAITTFITGRNYIINKNTQYISDIIYDSEIEENFNSEITKIYFY